MRDTGINHALQDLTIPGTTIVRTIHHAKNVVEILQKYPDRVHAWDTETFGIHPKEESPVGNGICICASAFIGPDVDFGNGPRLFIDNFADSKDVLNVFKDYFENE